MNNKDYLQKFRRRMYANRVCNQSEAQTSEVRENFNEMIDNMFPNATKLEMFARQTREGWDCWGNEV